MKLLSFQTPEETAKSAAAEASSYQWASAAAAPSTAKEIPVSVPPTKPMTPGLQEAVIRSLQYGQTGTSSIRACVGKTILKIIKDRFQLRPYPKKRGTSSDESGDLHSMEKIRDYARDGYAHFFFQ
ncbi:MAG: hypothetical protein ACKPKO_27740, partial [Candidatus Fonsibacter sp.]